MNVALGDKRDLVRTSRDWRRIVGQPSSEMRLELYFGRSEGSPNWDLEKSARKPENCIID